MDGFSASVRMRHGRPSTSAMPTYYNRDHVAASASLPSGVCFDGLSSLGCVLPGVPLPAHSSPALFPMDSSMPSSGGISASSSSRADSARRRQIWLGKRPLWESAGVPGGVTTFDSCDTICKIMDHVADADLLYPVIHQSFCTSNFPHHRLSLKIWVPIMLQRNISQSIGLYNGTRLGDWVLEAEIMTGSGKGERVCIPRIVLNAQST